MITRHWQVGKVDGEPISREPTPCGLTLRELARSQTDLLALHPEFVNCVECRRVLDTPKDPVADSVVPEKS